MSHAATYFFERALVHGDVAHDVRIAVDAEGLIERVEHNVPAHKEDTAFAAGLAGVPNAHSHAHQAAFAGRAEQRGDREDSFWTWRDVMYRYAQRMTPEQLGAVAAALYVDMLKGGYTCVGEFHYLHHGRDGAPYAELAQTGRRLLDAARRAGIALTLLPVLYRYGDFGDASPGRDQRRFVNDVDTYLTLLAQTSDAARDVPHAVVGLAPHSLRAVSRASLHDTLASSPLPDNAPVHIHIAEQRAEVEAAVRVLGQRPIEHLLQHFDVNERWCLVHATHAVDAEIDAVAERGAVVALCPSTEANLGDGLFDAVRFWQQGGRLAIGSDSNVCTDAAEELRWLEYGQRLIHQQRNLLTRGHSTGTSLLAAAQRGGAQALGQPAGALAAGHRADFVTLDTSAPGLAGAGDDVFDAFVFGAGRRAVDHVFVGGRQIIRHGRHVDDAAITAAAHSALESLAT